MSKWCQMSQAQCVFACRIHTRNNGFSSAAHRSEPHMMLRVNSKISRATELRDYKRVFDFGSGPCFANVF
jgi:hypothetical protein